MTLSEIFLHTHTHTHTQLPLIINYCAERSQCLAARRHAVGRPYKYEWTDEDYDDEPDEEIDGKAPTDNGDEMPTEKNVELNE